MSIPTYEEALRAAAEKARTDLTIPTVFAAVADCIDCENHGRCVCWTWQDEAEFHHEMSLS